jgi:16S rRNA (cytosine1402-N4)-methyltransferase
MRMDATSGVNAAYAVNHLPEQELANVIYTLGEERASRRIAAAVVRARAEAPVLDTQRLAEIIRSVLPRAADRLDPATRTFQALRIWVNDELGELQRGLIAAERLLATGGRLVVVAFHSLEDRTVKNFLKLRSEVSPRVSRHVPEIPKAAAPPSFRVNTKRAVRPSASEVAQNPRARSARMRAAERTAAPSWTSPTEPRRAA